MKGHPGEANACQSKHKTTTKAFQNSLWWITRIWGLLIMSLPANQKLFGLFGQTLFQRGRGCTGNGLYFAFTGSLLHCTCMWGDKCEESFFEQRPPRISPPPTNSVWAETTPPASDSPKTFKCNEESWNLIVHLCCWLSAGPLRTPPDWTPRRSKLHAPPDAVIGAFANPNWQSDYTGGVGSKTLAGSLGVTLRPGVSLDVSTSTRTWDNQSEAEAASAMRPGCDLSSLLWPRTL